MILAAPTEKKDQKQLLQAFIGLSHDSRWQYVISWLKSEEQRLFRKSRTSEGVLNTRQQGALILLDEFFTASDEKQARSVLEAIKKSESAVKAGMV